MVVLLRADLSVRSVSLARGQMLWFRESGNSMSGPLGPVFSLQFHETQSKRFPRLDLEYRFVADRTRDSGFTR